MLLQHTRSGSTFNASQLFFRFSLAAGEVDMSLDDLLREVIATGRLAEPFTASEAARAVSLDDWPLPKVQNFLARHCIGNLAASTLLVERVAYGKYRLIYDGPREDGDLEKPDGSGGLFHKITEPHGSRS